MTRLAFVLAFALLACRDEPAPSAQPVPTHASPPSPTTRPPVDVPPIDPWATPRRPDPDELPDFATTHALADRACPKVAQPHFYRVEKAGKVSHLLGTRHLGVSLAKMPDVVRREIAAAKLAVFEVAPGDDTDPARGDRRSLADQLGATTWKHYVDLVGERYATKLEHEPPAAALLILISMYEDKTAALDHEIEQQVLARKIPTRGLESSAFQDRLLAELLDVKLLRATIDGTKDRAQLERESAKDLGEYCAGTDEHPGMDDDTRAILLAGGYTEADIAALDDKLVYARNRDWIPKLEPILDRGGAFIAVGADHLIGPRGVVALLAARGYQTTRVKP